VATSKKTTKAKPKATAVNSALKPIPVPPKAKKGRPFKGIDGALDKLSYYSGAQGGRLSTPWQLSQYTPAYRFINPMELQAMRDRARELERNNPIADGMLTRAVENVVGEGFDLQATTSNSRWNKIAQGLWDEWTETADYNGLSWLEHCSLAYRSRLRDGDVLTVKLDNGQVQGIEGDLIWSPADSKGAAAVVDGILTDKGGRALVYYITPYGLGGRQEPVPYQANDCIFFNRVKRFGQLRGEPCFAQTFTLFDQIDKWIEATIVQARMAACVGLAVVKNNAAAFNGNLPIYPPAPGTPTGVPPARKIDFEPGMLPVFENGESLTQLNPNQPNQSFPDNLVSMMRLCGLTLGLPLELVLLDFSRTNFSSARASMLQAYRTFKKEQEIMIQRYLSPIYRWKIQTWIAQGKLPNRPDAYRHRFIGQGWSYLNPMQEAQANQILIDQGTLTIGQILQAQGHDFDTWLTQRKAELEKMAAAGVPSLHHNVMMPFPSPTTPSITTAKPDDEESDSSEDDEDDTEDTEDEKLEGAEDE
jgi:lambda family phage portal protein